MSSFRTGKVPPESLTKAVLPYLGRKSDRILVPPGIGRDAAAITFGDKILVFSTDPITGASRHIGAHSVIVNANDIATAGARPLWYLCSLMLPPGTNENALRTIMKEVHQASSSLGISVIGGHSEATRDLKQPIVAGFMVGETGPKSLVRSDGGEEGDVILLTKTAGLEGTAILASEHQSRLRGVPGRVLSRARGFFDEMSVVDEALAVARFSGVHAMHDPTEGGVLNGVWEMAESSHLGVEVQADKIPIAKETRVICSRLRLDPLKLMSSGCLLVSVSRTSAPTVMSKLAKRNVRVTEIACLTRLGAGRLVHQGGRTFQLKAVPRDELYKLS